jgi:RNA polymerase sigma-70 factor (ECF subfamily)
VLATLIRTTGDFELAEDAVQDAVVDALESWPRRGVPDNPGAWLTTVARRRALDRIRRESARRAKEQQATVRLLDERPGDVAQTTSMVADDVLRLIFTCCHPALAPEARVALTLRAVCGLATRDIAAAFLVSEATMGQRISRAKRKIAIAQIPYRVPADHELPERLPAVLSVVYVIFTAGHHSASGPGPVRPDLAHEAIRLARLLVDLLPDEPDAAGLLALLLATHARAETRLDADGELVLLADQDRSRWDHDAIDEAAALVDRALRRQRPGPYQVQAAIACLHGHAADWASTDWCQILQLYDVLDRLQPTPVVELNRAVAVAEVHGPAVALDVVKQLRGLEDWHLYWSTTADLLRRLHRLPDAAAAYRRALACDANDADRRFLRRRLLEVESAQRAEDR